MTIEHSHAHSLHHDEQEIEHIAKVAHAATQAHKYGEIQITWEAGKQSAIAAVKTALAHPSRSHIEHHEEWVKAELAAGKTHPHLVGHKSLSHIHQARNKLFYDVIDSLKNKG